MKSKKDKKLYTEHTFSERKRFLSQSGFTLIELLVVIAIVTVLASLVMVNLSTSRLKSRNAQRMSDLRQIQLAIEMFYDDFGYFPACLTYDTNGNPIDTSTCKVNSWCICVTATNDPYKLIKDLQNIGNYLPIVPLDPINSSGSSGYDYTYARGFRKNGELSFTKTDLKTDYVILGRLELLSGQSLTTVSGNSIGGSYPSDLVNSRQDRNVLMGNE